MSNLDPIQMADIVREQIRILDNAEGVTKDIIERANELLLYAEEEEANYIAELDYINGEQAKAEAEITQTDIDNMHDTYMRNK